MSIKKIIENFSKEEITQSFVLPRTISKKQQEDASEQLKKARLKVQQRTSDRTKLAAKLLQLKYRLEDYINSDQYDPKMRFGNFLKAYLDILNKKRKDFSSEIHIHETQVSQLISNTREPNDIIIVRLELHSNNNIPAEYWIQLLHKQKMHQLKSNRRIRQIERKHVLNKVPVKI